jgi:hypothetical protein
MRKRNNQSKQASLKLLNGLLEITDQGWRLLLSVSYARQSKTEVVVHLIVHN